MKSISSSPPLNRCIQMIGIMLLFLWYHIVYRKVLLYGHALRRKKNIYEIAYHNNNIRYIILHNVHTRQTRYHWHYYLCQWVCNILQLLYGWIMKIKIIMYRWYLPRELWLTRWNLAWRTPCRCRSRRTVFRGRCAIEWTFIFWDLLIVLLVTVRSSGFFQRNPEISNIIGLIIRLSCRGHVII